MAYYTKPIRMKISPLRSNALNRVQVQLRNNKFDISNSPKFLLDGAGLYASKNISERAHLNESKIDIRKQPLHTNPEFTHVYAAMKDGNKELDVAVNKKQPVFFDTNTVQYDPIYDDYSKQTYSHWPYLAKCSLYDP